MRALLVKRTRCSNTYNKDDTHTLPIRCECSINSILSAIPFPLCWYISRSHDGLCCMKPTTESEVLVLLVFFATVPAGLATDRTTTCTRYADIATSHESNRYFTNQLRRISFSQIGREDQAFHVSADVGDTSLCDNPHLASPCRADSSTETYVLRECYSWLHP